MQLDLLCTMDRDPAISGLGDASSWLLAHIERWV